MFYPECPGNWDKAQTQVWPLWALELMPLTVCLPQSILEAGTSQVQPLSLGEPSNLPSRSQRRSISFLQLAALTQSAFSNTAIHYQR